MLDMKKLILGSIALMAMFCVTTIDAAASPKRLADTLGNAPATRAVPPAPKPVPTIRQNFGNCATPCVVARPATPPQPRLRPGDAQTRGMTIRSSGDIAAAGDRLNRLRNVDTRRMTSSQANEIFSARRQVQQQLQTAKSRAHTQSISVRVAGQNLANQIGRNRVSVATPSGRMHIDLAGKSHFERQLGYSVTTPHVRFQNLHTGPNGMARLDGGSVRHGTMQDVRTARKVIERRGN